MPPKPDDSRPPIPDLLWPGVVAHISAIVANMKAVAAGEGESDGDDEGVGAMLDLVVTASETTWERLCVDLLPVMQLPLRIPAICHRVSCLNKARHQPPAATVASFKSSFREHPDWPGLYACMLVSRPLRRAVCRDPELRPLTRHGLNAVLTWLATPAGRREFDALELNHQEDILLSVSFSVFWVGAASVDDDAEGDVKWRPELSECFLQPLPGANLSYAQQLVQVLALGVDSALPNIFALLPERTEGSGCFSGLSVRLFNELCAQPAALRTAARRVRALTKQLRALEDPRKADRLDVKVGDLVRWLEFALEDGASMAAAEAAAAGGAGTTSSASPAPSSSEASSAAAVYSCSSLRAFFGSELWLALKGLARINALPVCFHQLVAAVPTVDPRPSYDAVIAACHVVLLGAQQLPPGMEVGDPELLRHAAQQRSFNSTMDKTSASLTAPPNRQDVKDAYEAVFGRLGSGSDGAAGGSSSSGLSDESVALLQSVMPAAASLILNDPKVKFKRCWGCRKQGISGDAQEQQRPVGSGSGSGGVGASGASSSSNSSSGAAVKLLKCGRCREALYCSAECQKQHWKVHKASCVKRDSHS